ncbi:MAG: hypothetical protein V4850_20785 [Myxococcota bacterium]
MILTCLLAFASAATVPVAEIRGGVVRGIVGYPDLVGGELGAHLGGWHLGLGYSNIIIVNSVFVRGGPEWVVSSTERDRGLSVLLFSPSVEYRAYTHSHLAAIQHGGSITAGLELIEPLGGGWIADLRLDAGAVYLFDSILLPHVRLSFGFGVVPNAR